MRNNHFYTFFLTITLVILASCGRNGSIAPTQLPAGSETGVTPSNTGEGNNPPPAANTDTSINNFSLLDMQSITPTPLPCSTCEIDIVLSEKSVDLKLVPTFQAVGTVTLTDGTVVFGQGKDAPIDFSKDVIFNVTAPDGVSKATYTVKVTAPALDTSLSNFRILKMLKAEFTANPDCDLNLYQFCYLIEVTMPTGTGYSKEMNLTFNSPAFVTKKTGGRLNSDGSANKIKFTQNTPYEISAQSISQTVVTQYAIIVKNEN